MRRTIWRGVVGLPKGGRERTVNLPASAKEVLKAHRHLCGPYVFCQQDGQPLTAGGDQPPLLRALRMAGVSLPWGCIGRRDLRHAYGRHLAKRGVALKVIQELMGHATTEMTMRYARLSPEAWESAVQELALPIPQPRAALG